MTEREDVIESDKLLPIGWYSIRPTSDRPGVDLSLADSSQGLLDNRYRLAPRSARDLVSDLLMMLQMSLEEHNEPDLAQKCGYCKYVVRSILMREEMDHLK
jgi:hypothetical protein